MSNETGQTEIAYKPSLAGMAARIIMPFLQKVLPFSAYQWVYNVLYSSYKNLLHGLYLFRVAGAKLFGSKSDKLKTSLTFKLLPYTMGGRKALENAFTVTEMAEQNNIPGALVECGVAEGGTSAMMAMANREIGDVARQKWLFDSYEGLPEPTEEDYMNGKAGEFIRPLPKGSCLGTIEQVEELMFEYLKFPREEVHMVKGWFQDTVPPHKGKLGPIAVLRLDGDWYESTKIPLDNFYEHVSPGGYVIIDDYATCFGSQKATDEFRAEHNITTPLNPDGRGGVWFIKPE